MLHMGWSQIADQAMVACRSSNGCLQIEQWLLADRAMVACRSSNGCLQIKQWLLDLGMII